MKQNAEHIDDELDENLEDDLEDGTEPTDEAVEEDESTADEFASDRDTDEDTEQQNVEAEAPEVAPVKPKKTKAKKKPAAKPKPKTKHDEFVDLYAGNDEHATVDMTTLERGNRKKRLMTIFGVSVVVLSLLAMILGYMAFSKNRLVVTPGDVAVEIDAPTTVASGDEVELTITYRNDSAAAITIGSLEVVTPTGFYFSEASPEPDLNENHWDIANLAPGSEEEITVKGQLVGQLGESKTFNALFTYTPVNFSSNFQTSSNTTVTVGESIMKLDVTAPEQVRSGEEMQYVFTITNTAALALVNGKADVTFPDGFTITSADPAASQSNHVWEFDEIEPNGTVTVTVKGTMDTDAKAEQEFLLQTGIQQPDGFFNLQAEDRRKVKVINPELGLKLSGPASAGAGEELEYSIELSNPSKVDINDIELSIDFTDGATEQSTATLDTINKLAPGDTKQLTYTTTVNDPLPDSVTELVATLSIKAAQVDGSDVEFTDTAEVTTSVQGSVAVSAEARYYADDLSKLGSGPIPPKVGKTTTYAIIWSVSATGSGMENASVSATLPVSATFGSGDSNVSYNASTRTVTWEAGDISSDSSTNAKFTVSITPSSNDVNKLVALLNETIVTATDANSKASLQAQAKKLTSNLSNDPGALEDSGVVAQ